MRDVCCIIYNTIYNTALALYKCDDRRLQSILILATIDFTAKPLHIYCRATASIWFDELRESHSLEVRAVRTAEYATNPTKKTHLCISLMDKSQKYRMCVCVSMMHMWSTYQADIICEQFNCTHSRHSEHSFSPSFKPRNWWMKLKSHLEDWKV